MVDTQPSAFDELRRLADTAKPIGFKLNDNGVGKGVVDRKHVDVLGPDSRHAPYPLTGEVASLDIGARTRMVPGRIVRIGARAAAHDIDRRLAQVEGALARRDDERRRHVSLQAAVEQPKWLGDPSRSL